MALILAALLAAAQPPMPPGYDDPGPPPANVIPALVERLRLELRDPQSIHDLTVCAPSTRGAVLEPGRRGAWRPALWTVTFALNSKNGLGGYTGRRRWVAMFAGDKVTSLMSGELRDWPELDAALDQAVAACPRIPDAEVQKLLAD